MQGTHCEFSKCLGKQIASSVYKVGKRDIFHILFSWDQQWSVTSWSRPTGCRAPPAQFPRRPAAGRTVALRMRTRASRALGSGRASALRAGGDGGSQCSCCQARGGADAEIAKFREKFVFDSISQGLHLSSRDCPAPLFCRPWVPAVLAVHRLPGFGVPDMLSPPRMARGAGPFLRGREGWGWGRGFDRVLGQRVVLGLRRTELHCCSLVERAIPAFSLVALIFFISARL